VPITQSGDLYHYRSFVETSLTYGSEAAASHFTNSFWYLDKGDMVPSVPKTSDNSADATNIEFITCWDKIKQSKEFPFYGTLHSDLCNVPNVLLPGINLHIKLSKARSNFYLMNSHADCKSTFKFMDAKLFVKRIRANPDILSAHITTLREGGTTKYNLTKVEFIDIHIRSWM
jgi:hypothetical protein